MIFNRKVIGKAVTPTKLPTKTVNQYIETYSSVWGIKDVFFSSQDNKWGAIPDLILFENGDTKSSITGGWYVQEGYPGNGGTTTVSFSNNGSSLQMRAPYWSSGGYSTVNTIDVSNYNTLVAEWTSSGATSSYCHMNLYNTEIVGNGNGSTVIYPSPSMVPISSSTPVKIGIGLGNSDGKTYYITKVYLTNR